MTGTKTDIPAIVQRVQDGDREAFTEVVREYQARLRILIRVLLWDRSIVDDVTQEVFVAAYVRIDSYVPSEGEFYAWLKGIARKIAANENRRSKRRSAKIKGDYLATIRIDQGFTDAPATEAWLDSAIERLNTCMGRLPEKVQKLFRRIYWEKMKIEAVAELEAMSASAVKVAALRGRALLKTCMESRG